MSTYTESLLRKYNKHLQPIAETENDDENKKRFGTWSYANPYDALYDKYSHDPNFNMNMWQDAIQRGEQDTYLSLVEMNKGKTFTSQFYDPTYYDYEAMMMEMSLVNADDTKSEQRTRNFYNDVSGKMETEDLGSMTDKQYYQFLLNENRVAYTEEINREIEQWRKDQLSDAHKFWADVGATFAEFGEGLLTGLTGMIDFVASPFAAAGIAWSDGVGGKDYLDAFVDYFGEHSLTAAEKRIVRVALDDYERLNTHFRDVDGNVTSVGKYFTGIANSIGMMVPAIIANLATGGAASLAWVGTATFYASMFGSSMHETATNEQVKDSPSGVKILNTAVKTGAEAIIEYTLGKLLGGTIQNQAIGFGGKVGANTLRGFGKMAGFKYFTKSALQEGLEEFLQDFGTNCVDQFTGMFYEGYGNTGVTFQTLVDSFVIGTLSSMIMSTGQLGLSAMSSARANKIKPGSGDLVVEITPGETKKLTGFTKMAYADMLSNFKESIDKLKKGKLNTTKNVELAQEVYAGLSVISQFYASMSKERIKNCEMLLDRVIKAERALNTKTNEVVSSTFISQKTADAMKSMNKTTYETGIKSFVDKTETLFNTMISTKSTNQIQKTKDALKKLDDKGVLKNGGVNEAKAVVDADGNVYEAERNDKSSAVKDIEKRFGKKAVATFEELRKDYEWAFIVDGHTVAEEGDTLVVSDAWLGNFSADELREFLVQTRVIELLTRDSYPKNSALANLPKMRAKLTAFVKEFTKQDNITDEQAMTYFLFQEPIYQGFLLSEGARNANDFKEFIFGIHRLINDFVRDSDYYNRNFKGGKISQKRVLLADKIYDRMRQIMRRPTIKAIVNWGFEIQDINPGDILNENDLKFLNQYKRHRELIATVGQGVNNPQAYVHTVDEIRSNTRFSSTIDEMIDRDLKGETDEREHFMVRMALDLADYKIRDTQSNTYGAFTIPVEAISLAGQSPAYAQFVADKLSEFEQMYGISAKQMISGDLAGMSMSQIEQLTQDMQMLGKDDYTQFVMYKLESMLGEDYVVTPTALQHDATVQRLERDYDWLDQRTRTLRNAQMFISQAAQKDEITQELDIFRKEMISLFRAKSSKDYLAPELFKIAKHFDIGEMRSNRKIRSLIDKYWDKIDNLLSEASERLEGLLEKARENTSITDFVVARAIPADQFFSKDILEKNIDERNEIFLKLFDGVERTPVFDFNVETSFETIRNKFKNALSDEKDIELFTIEYLENANKELDVLNLRLEAGEAAEDVLRDFLANIARGVDPFNGEYIAESNTVGDMRRRKLLMYDVIHHYTDLEQAQTIQLSDIIDVTAFPNLDLSYQTITLKNVSEEGLLGVFYSSSNNIIIARGQSDYFATLTHEINHLLQQEFNLPNGFNTEAAYEMPDFLAHVCNNYPELVAERVGLNARVIDGEYYIRSEDYSGHAPDLIPLKHVTAEQIKKMIDSLGRISHTAYAMVQGEIWARTYTHNGKQIRGYTHVITDSGSYILAPDGKTKFKTGANAPTSSASTSASTSMQTPEALAQAGFETAMDKAILKLFALKMEQERNPSSDRFSKTYHSQLTKASSASLTGRIVNPEVPFMDRVFLTLDQIIRDPDFLSPEIREMCNGDFSEGNVFYRTKEWVEANLDGISIDRSNKHKYIWVDNNAFDDLIVTSLKAKIDGEDSSLVEKYMDTGRIPLSRFYSKEQLDELGIHPNTFVQVGSNSATETIFDTDTRTGGIIINPEIRVNDETRLLTDAEFFDRLNHEFRHVLQTYNGFEKGFTPRFEVSDEMLNDIKKHIPMVFKNDDVVTWAKKRFGDRWQKGIAQQFVYMTVGGELNAYGFLARDLGTKPTYVDYEAGIPTIYLPWYNAKTGEGRYTTKFIAMRAEDETDTSVDTSVDEKKKRITREGIPKVDKEKKLLDKHKGQEAIYDENGKLTGFKSRNKYLATKANQDNNLKYFVKRYKEDGRELEMPEDLMGFIKDTTGNEDKIPTEIMDTISGENYGMLNRDALLEWFRTADDNELSDDFLFNLFNKHFFKNDYIKNFKELNKFLEHDTSYYWAAAMVLAQHGIDYQFLLNTQDIDTFKEMINALSEIQAEQIGEDFHKMREKYLAQITDKSLSKKTRAKAREKVKDLEEHYPLTLGEKIDKRRNTYEKGRLKNVAKTNPDVLSSSKKARQYMRVFVMLHYDGTLASAFYAADAVKGAMRHIESDTVRGNISTSTEEEGKDGKGRTVEDKLSNAAINKMSREANNSVANDIRALYEQTHVFDENLDDMIFELASAYALSLTDTVTDIAEHKKKSLSYLASLKEKDYDEIRKLYIGMKQKDFSGVDTIQNTNTSRISRRSIAASLRTVGNRLARYIAKGKIRFHQLPQDVQDMFELVTDAKGRKTSLYRLKEDVYTVGRGRKALPGTADTIAAHRYVQKHNVNDSTEAYRHDTTKLVENLDKLRAQIQNIDDTEKKKAEAIAEGKQPRGDTYKRVSQANSKNLKSIAEALNNRPVRKSEDTAKYTHEIKISRAQKRLSDVPSTFNIVSDVPMPTLLRKLLDTSFDRFADTDVQFVSRNEKGELYDKEKFEKRKDFESLTQHEVTNWKDFLEVNRETLLSLSRNDVLDIVEFFEKAGVGLGGPTGKFNAFRIFTLGYILDAARRNAYDWNLSDAQINHINALYETAGSALGIGLKAVQQMLGVVNPLRALRQLSLEMFDAIPETERDDYLQLVEHFDEETDAKRQRELSIDILNGLQDFAKRQREANTPKYNVWSKEWWKHFVKNLTSWTKIKNFRYLGMLSSPLTWIRNIVSNMVLKPINYASDQLGRLIFTKKSYRKEQWDLVGTKVSDDAKNFIDEYILKNPIFNPQSKEDKENAINVYNLSGKYDARQKKSIKTGKSVFVDVITKAIERKFAADNRFESGTMRAISKFVDRMISDDRFVKAVVKKYFGKMLTIEVENGNIDLSKGLSGDALNLFAEAVILGNIEYMHKRSFMSDLFDDMRNEHPKLYEAINLWQPFLNSSFNWYAEILKLTPIGLAASIVKMSKLEQQITKLDERRAKGETVATSRVAEFLARRDIGKGVVGLIFAILGGILVATGAMRIEEDDDKFYLHTKNTKIDISNIFASSSVLVGASIVQPWVKESDASVGEKIEEAAKLFTGTILDGFFATDILDRHRWGNGWEDVLTETESVMKSFVPQIVQLAIACTNTANIRYSSGIKGVFERYINSWVPTQPAGNRRINPYTGEIEDKYALPVFSQLAQKGLFFGSKIYWIDISENERLAREYGVNKAELTGEITVNGSKVMLDRYTLNKKYGELNNKNLPKIKSQKHEVKMPDGTYKTLSWDDMSKDQRGDVIERTMRQNSDLAKIYVWTNVMGKKYYATNATYERLKAAGITQNVYRGDKGFVG